MRTNRHEVKRANGTEDSVIEIVAYHELPDSHGVVAASAENMLYTTGGLHVIRLKKGMYEIETTKEVMTSDAADAP